MSENLPATVQPMVLVQQLMQRPDFTTDMLKDLLEMVKEQEHRADLRLFRAAFHRCQRNVMKAKGNKTNPLFHSKYASIDAMYDAVWPAVMEEGFDWVVSALAKPPAGWDNGMIWFQGRLSMGMVTETVELPVPPSALQPEGAKGNRAAMTPMQSVGALTTYMRKYLLGLMFSVVTGDDLKVDADGNRHIDSRKGNGSGTNPHDEWPAWLSRLAASLERRTTKEAVDMVQTSIKENRQNAPPDVQRDIDRLLAAAYARVMGQPTEGEPDAEIERGDVAGTDG